MISYINNIPFKFVGRYGNAVRFRIGNTNHLVFLPKQYVNKDNTIDNSKKLDWFLNKKDTKHKLELINGKFNLDEVK